MKIRKADGFVLVLFTSVYVLKLLSFGYPNTVTSYYTQQIYPVVQTVQQRLSSCCSFPMSYLVIIGYLILSSLFIWNVARKFARKQCFFKLVRYLGYSFVLFYVSFQLLWGFNYAQRPLIQILALVDEPINQLDIELEIIAVQDTLLSIRNQLDTITLYSTQDITTLKMIVPLVENALQHHQLSVIKGLQFKVLRPRGILLHWSTAGIYFPFTGECNIDDGLHPIQVPFTLAHELAHGQGWGDEATCNFIAWLSLQNSDNEIFRYSAWFDYWRELLGNYRKNYPESYKKIYQNIDIKLFADLKSIRKQMELYEDWFPTVRNKIYDHYLKSQGVGEGIKSYNAMVKLVFAYKRKTLLHR